MVVIKRDGRSVDFDPKKIRSAVLKAFREVDGEISETAESISGMIAAYFDYLRRDTIGVEEIQDYVESLLMSSERKDVARAYTRFRYMRELSRSTLDTTILEIIDGENEYWNGENSNKNPKLNTTVRDYMAGAISTDISKRILIPKDVVDAHDVGILHFHDMDYFAQAGMYNCCLINVKDMLENGSVISETMIESPHTFSTACTVTTQISAQVASSQYGGQSISLAHLAPYVDVSRQHFKEQVAWELYECGFIGHPNKNNPDVIRIAESRLKEEITKGIQTIQYQITTLMTTNG